MSEEHEVRLRCLDLASSWIGDWGSEDDSDEVTAGKVTTLAGRLAAFVMGGPPKPDGVADGGDDGRNARPRAASCFVCGHNWDPRLEGVYCNMFGKDGALVLSCPKCGVGHLSVQPLKAKDAPASTTTGSPPAAHGHS